MISSKRLYMRLECKRRSLTIFSELQKNQRRDRRSEPVITSIREKAKSFLPRYDYPLAELFGISEQLPLSFNSPFPYRICNKIYG